MAIQGGTVCEPPLRLQEQKAVMRLFRRAGFRVGATRQYQASELLIELADPTHKVIDRKSIEFVIP